MARVLVVTHNYPPILGGVSNLVLYMCKSFKPDEVCVLAPWGVHTMAHDELNAASRDVSIKFDEQQPFKVYRASYSQKSTFSTFFSVLRFAVLTIWIVFKEKPDIVYFSQPYPLALSGLILRIAGIPFVSQTHGSELVRPLGRLAKWLRRIIMRNAFKMIANSHWGKEKLIEMGVDPRHVVIINPKVEFTRFEKPVNMEDFKTTEGLVGKRAILTVARLLFRKGQHLVIRALPEVLKKHPDVVYVVVGNGPDREKLEMEAKEYGVEDHVLFPGNRDVIAFYHACEIFIMPSLYIEKPYGDVESFGIVYIEANACSKPVIGANNGGVPDAIIDGVTGLLVETDDVPSIVDGLNRLLDDPELSVRLGEQGYERVRSEFTADKYAEEFRRLVLEEK